MTRPTGLAIGETFFWFMFRFSLLAQVSWLMRCIMDRSGKWLGDWRYDFQEKVLVGMYQIKVHYFEDGNVQLLCSRQFHYSMQEKEVGLAFLAFHVHAC